MALLNQKTEEGAGVQEIHSISINPTSLTTLTEVDITATITGVGASDLVVAFAPNDLEAGLVWKQAYVSAANTVTVTVANISGSTIDGAACTGYVTIQKFASGVTD